MRPYLLAVTLMLGCSKPAAETPSSPPPAAPSDAVAPPGPSAPAPADAQASAAIDAQAGAPIDATAAAPTDVAPPEAPPFTPPRPLPPALAPLGARCTSGDGAACEELATALEKRGLLFTLIAPWVERGCELGHRPACERLVDQSRALLERRGMVVVDLDGLVLPDAPADLERLCELGYWQACAHLATTFGLENCPLARTYDVADAFKPDEARTRAALTRARPLAEKACDAKDSEACGWLAAMFADDCGYGHDAAKAEALFLRQIALSDLAARCETDLAACRTLSQRCEAFGEARRDLEEEPPPSNGVQKLPIDWADATSTLPPWKGYRFDADQLRDGSLNTSWQPLDKRRGGVGQKVTLGFKAPRQVSAITIANGFQRQDKLGDLFLLNNRVRAMRLTFSDGSQQRLELGEKDRGSVRFDFKPRLVKSLELEVLSIWRGEKWNDLAISEIEIFGNQDTSVAKAEPPLPAVCEVPATVARRRCDADDWPSCEALPGLRRFRADLSADTLVIAVGERLCAERTDGGICLATARLLARVQPGGEADLETRQAEHRAHLSKLAARACTLGNFEACGEVGCHGEVIGGASASGDFDLAPKLCKPACEAGDIISCFALAEAAHKGVLDNYDHPENKRLRERLTECAEAEACVEAAKQAEKEPTFRYGFPEVVLQYTGYLERACELGSAKGCAELSFEASSFGLGDRAQKRACELDPKDCGQADLSTAKTPLAELVKRCGQHEVEACGLACAALESSSEPRAELLKSVANPELGMTPMTLERLCSEATLFDPCSCGCC